MARITLYAAAAVKVAVTLATDSRYGFHIDELYYVAAGRHLAWGYVDFPPLAPLLARAGTSVFGNSLVGLRLLPLAAGVGVIALTVLIVRELGGDAKAQLVAGAALLSSGFFLGASGLFQPVAFDQLTWALCLYLATRLLISRNAKLWVPLGAAFGLGLLTKYTIVALAAGLLVGLSLTPARALLRSRWLLLGAIIPAALIAPNLAWQAQHHWPTLEFISHQNAQVRADYPPARYLGEQVIVLGPAAFALTLVGARRLWRAAPLRALPIAAIVVLVWYLALGGKSYYPLTVYPVLIAAGAVTAATHAQRWLIAIAVSALVALPIALPVLPESLMAQARLYELRQDYADEIGWPDLAASTSRVYRALPRPERATAMIVTSNYGEAGAIDLYRSKYPNPPATSRHNTYWYWRPHDPDRAVVITVGMPRALVERWFADITPAGRLANTAHLHNREWGQPIYLGRHPRHSVSKFLNANKLFGTLH